MTSNWYTVSNLIEVILQVYYSVLVCLEIMALSHHSQIFISTHLNHNGLNDEHYYNKYSPDDSNDLLLLRHYNDNTKKENFSIYRSNEASEVF